MAARMASPEAAHEISLQRIVAQRLAGPRLPDAVAAVSHMSAMQAQDLRAVTEAVALRSGGSPLAEALTSGAVVRSWPMRSTLHLVTAADLPRMLALTADRQLAQSAHRREALGIDEGLVSRAARLAREVIDDAGPASRADLASAWAPLGTDRPGIVYHLIYTLSVRAVLVQGPPHPTRAGEQLFVRYESLVGSAPDEEPEEALAEWAAAYGRSHGPVTEYDFARWAGLPATQCRRALRDAAEADVLEEVRFGGVTYWRDPEVPGLVARYRLEADQELLVPAFDELIIGYADRTATLDAAHEGAVVPGKNGVFLPVAVRGGRAHATWSRGPTGEVRLLPFP